jgi:hypothetical protein
MYNMYIYIYIHEWKNQIAKKNQNNKHIGLCQLMFQYIYSPLYYRDFSGLSGFLHQ